MVIPSHPAPDRQALKSRTSCSSAQPCAFPMRRSLTLCLLVPAALLAACASGPAPLVTRLGDGVYKSPTAKDAEAYCRNFGAPLRYLDPKAAARAPNAEVTYRCD